MNDPAGDATPSGIVRLRIDLAYDGTEFVGWARQPGLRSVQGELERGFRFACKPLEEPRVTCAGRTDSGVHARGQVAHIDVPVATWERLAERNLYPLRSVLPSDIAVYKVDLAPVHFDARFSALSRRYIYRVCDDPVVMDPIRRREVYYHPNPLDLDAMNEAADGLLGLQDFAAFCRQREGATTIRTLEQLEWHRSEDGFAELTVVADAFCHSMVRSLVGSLLPVGVAKQQPDWPASFFGQTERGPFTVAPAHGLTLEEVTYPPDSELEARNLRTRDRRSIDYL